MLVSPFTPKQDNFPQAGFFVYRARSIYGGREGDSAPSDDPTSPPDVGLGEREATGLVPESNRELSVCAITQRWAIFAAAIVFWTASESSPASEHEMIWAAKEPSASFHFGVGGWWLAYAARPTLIILLMAWLWRPVLSWRSCYRNASPYPPSGFLVNTRDGLSRQPLKALALVRDGIRMLVNLHFAGHYLPA